jgi:UDP-galactopyranose mutase
MPQARSEVNLFIGVKYDYLIVGAGLFGAVCARELTHHGKKCLVIDRNLYVGGNCHTNTREGIIVHSFGPHVFHTHKEEIWKYMNQFGTFAQLPSKVKSFYRGRMFSFPINLLTLHQLWGITTPEEAHRTIELKRKKIESPKNFKEQCLSMVGDELYDIFIDGYTRKQWKTDPENLDASLAKRVSVRMNFDDRYHNDLYQGVPLEGYTKLIENILGGVEVRLGEEFNPQWESVATKIIYTGRIDQYYNFSLGPLSYRTTRFEHEMVSTNDVQGCAVINYPDINVPYTRIVEHKHLTPLCQNTTSSVITHEYPIDWDESQSPLYPSIIPSDRAIYQNYLHLSAQTHNVIFGGRLGSYSYLDMDDTIEEALKLCSKLLSHTTMNPFHGSRN